MDDEHAPEVGTVAEPERPSPPERPADRLVEQRGPALSGADWFFAHAMTMRAATVRPLDDGDPDALPGPADEA